MVQRYREGAVPLVVSRYGQVRAPPMLYDRSLWGELEEPGGVEFELPRTNIMSYYIERGSLLPCPRLALSPTTS